MLAHIVATGSLPRLGRPSLRPNPLTLLLSYVASAGCATERCGTQPLRVLLCTFCSLHPLRSVWQATQLPNGGGITFSVPVHDGTVSCSPSPPSLIENKSALTLAQNFRSGVR